MFDNRLVKLSVAAGEIARDDAVARLRAARGPRPEGHHVAVKFNADGTATATYEER